MKYANSADLDQTAPERAVWSGSKLFAIKLSILRNCCIKSKISAKIVGKKKFEILKHLPYWYMNRSYNVRKWQALG